MQQLQKKQGYIWPLIQGAFLPLRNEPLGSLVSICPNTHPPKAACLATLALCFGFSSSAAATETPECNHALGVGRREACKYTRLENP